MNSSPTRQVSGIRTVLSAPRLVAAAVLAVCGCSGVGEVVDPFNVLGLARPPVRIGVTTLDLAPPPLMLPKRTLFQQDLAFHLDEPVAFELLTPRQVRVHLSTGRVKFAMLTPADYMHIAPAGTSRILAVPKNRHGDVSRRGLIITARNSPVQQLSDVRKRRFHRMPAGDDLNDAALAALIEAGVAVGDVDKGILGLELDTSHISSLEVAKSVAMEAAEGAVGVIDEHDYNAWPKTGGSFMLLMPSQDQVRVIATTVRVPSGPFVVSVHTPEETTNKVRDYLFNVAARNKLVLAAMDCTGFAEPIPVEEYEPYFAAYRRLHPEAASQPAEEEPLPGSEPATLSAS